MPVIFWSVWWNSDKTFQRFKKSGAFSLKCIESTVTSRGQILEVFKSMEKLCFTIRWDVLQYLMINVLKKTLNIQPQEPVKDASHISSLSLLQVSLNSCCIHAAEWRSYSSLFPLLQETSLCERAKIGLPMPLHACKSHHAACDSSYEVTPATNHILLTWNPGYGKDGALDSGGLPIMVY